MKLLLFLVVFSLNPYCVQLLKFRCVIKVKEVVLQQDNLPETCPSDKPTIGGLGYICARLLLPEIRCQCFIRIFLRFY